MGHETASADQAETKVPKNVSKIKRHAKIRRIVFGSAAFLAAAFLGGNFLLMDGSGTSAGKMSPDSSPQTTSSPDHFSDVSSAASELSPSPVLSQTLFPTTTPTTTPTPMPSPTPRPILSSTPTPVPEIRATLTAVGDIILHKSVIDGGLTNPGEAVPIYDFSLDFQYISSVFQESDLAMGNFEGTLNGPPYTGFPSFSAHDAIADALPTIIALIKAMTVLSARRPFFAIRALRLSVPGPI